MRRCWPSGAAATCTSIWAAPTKQPADKAIEDYRKAAEGSGHSPAAWLALGVVYSRNDSGKSEQAFQEAERLFQLSSNLEGLTELAVQRGIATGSRSQLDRSDKYLAQALETAHLAGNLHQEVVVTLRLSTNAYMSGDPVGAERYAREALQIARLNRIDSLAVRGLNTLGRAYLRKGDVEGAEKYFEEALTLARSGNSPRLAALNLLSLATLHDGRRRDEAEREASEALSFYRPNGFPKEVAQCLTIMGRSRLARDDTAGGLALFQEAASAASASKDPSMVALTEESLATLLSAQERYPESLPHFQREYQIAPTEEMRGYAALNSGKLLWHLGRYPEAEAAFALAEPAAARFAPLSLRLLRARAGMALSQERFADARNQAERALERATGSNDRGVQTELRRILGVALAASGQPAKGLPLCRESLESAISAAQDSEAVQARLAMAEAFLYAGDRAGALATLRGHEPDAHYPESRWRALALLARAGGAGNEQVRTAARDLRQLWGDSPFQQYLTRPDVAHLTRPLPITTPANPR